MARLMLAVLLFETILVTGAPAETFRCTLHHVIRVGANGLMQEDKRANLDVEFFLSIDNQTEKGTLSICRDSGCENASEVMVIRRDTGFLHRISLLYGAGVELWSLEAFGDSQQFTAAAASVSGQSSQSRFGKCRIVVQ